jgi:hypothetical protein
VAIGELSLNVTGRPALLTSSRAISDAWKTAVWTAAVERWTLGTVAEPCSVSLTFRIPRASFAATAIGNLLKSTIDGLSRALFAHVTSGQPGPWSTEDWWICDLSASKIVAEADAGVEIRFSSDCAGPALPHVGEIEVVGSPAVWIGSGERDWRVRLSSAVAAAHPPVLPDRLGVELGFKIESQRMKSADIDNLCVPALQAVHGGLFGPYRPGQPNRIASFRATKEESRQPGLRVGFFETR